LISMLIQVNPDHRPTVSDVLGHHKFMDFRLSEIRKGE